METYLSMAENYNDFHKLFTMTDKLNLKNFIVSKHLAEEQLDIIKPKLNPKLIKNSLLFNFLRTQADLIISCTDGEDKHSIYVTKYAINHRIPLLVFTNFDYHLLEVV